MAATIICDGCGKVATMVFYKANPNGWHKPEEWFRRSDETTGPQDACSRECVDIVAAKTGATAVVLPW